MDQATLFRQRARFGNVSPPPMFNTAVQPRSRWIGTGCWAATQPCPDLQQLNAILDGQDLVLLNSSRPTRLMPTFFSDFDSSHIDFSLTRRGLAEKMVRMAGPWRCGLHAWRRGIFARIRSRLFMQAPLTRTPRMNKNALWKAGTPAVQTMHAEVAELTQSGPCDAAPQRRVALHRSETFPSS